MGNYFTYMNEVNAGTILISDPFLRDPNFMRTAVFVCEHTAVGTLGFVLNRPFEQKLEEFVPDLEGYHIPVHYGGPVQPDTLHFLHNIPELRQDAQCVIDGVYWGGDFLQLVPLIQQRKLDLDRIRFYLGYSGWSEGQLDGEINEKTWLTVSGSKDLVFHQEPTDVWREAVRRLDKSFHPIINYPIDPRLN